MGIVRFVALHDTKLDTVTRNYRYGVKKWQTKNKNILC